VQQGLGGSVLEDIACLEQQLNVLTARLDAAEARKAGGGDKFDQSATQSVYGSGGGGVAPPPLPHAGTALLPGAHNREEDPGATAGGPHGLQQAANDPAAAAALATNNRLERFRQDSGVPAAGAKDGAGSEAAGAAAAANAAMGREGNAGAMDGARRGSGDGAHGRAPSPMPPLPADSTALFCSAADRLVAAEDDQEVVEKMMHARNNPMGRDWDEETGSDAMLSWGGSSKGRKEVAPRISAETRVLLSKVVFLGPCCPGCQGAGERESAGARGGALCLSLARSLSLPPPLSLSLALSLAPSPPLALALSHS